MHTGTDGAGSMQNAPIPAIIRSMNGAELLRSVGLMPDGPAVLGRPTRAGFPGVYVVELGNSFGSAPIDMVRVGKWIERVPSLRLDDERPTSKQLAARLAAFWLPGQTVVFVGSSTGTVSGKLRALDAQVLGEPRPHASAQWLKALRPDVVDRLRVWWAATDAPEEYEDALLDAFVESVAVPERQALADTMVVLPWANQRRPGGERRRSGLANATLPLERAAPPPPTSVVDLPPGAADGVAEARNTGTLRRTNASPPAQRAPTRATRSAPATPRPRTPRPAPSRRPEIAPVQLTADGMTRLHAELTDLTTVRRPQVIERIVRGRELGDLKENAEYQSAREEQSFLEGRIQALEERLRHAVVVEAPTHATRVVLGSKVRTEFLDEEIAFEIVGSSEADAGAGRISDVSPVGRALLGRSVGDEAIVMTPRGEARYRILAIE
jgi:transcription elongation factor GreA